MMNKMDFTVFFFFSKYLNIMEIELIENNSLCKRQYALELLNLHIFVLYLQS